MRYAVLSKQLSAKPAKVGALQPGDHISTNGGISWWHVDRLHSHGCGDISVVSSQRLLGNVFTATERYDILDDVLTCSVNR
jgi:hypothetical protein